METTSPQVVTRADHQPVPAQVRTPAAPAPSAKAVTAVAVASQRRPGRRIIPEGFFLSGFCGNSHLPDMCRRCPHVLKNGSKADHLYVTCICDCHPQ